MVLVRIASIVLACLGIIGVIWFSLSLLSSGIDLFSLIAFLLSIILVVVSAKMSFLRKTKNTKTSKGFLKTGKILSGFFFIICTGMSILFYWIGITMAEGSKSNPFNIRKISSYYYDSFTNSHIGPSSVVNILMLIFAVCFIFLHLSERKLNKFEKEGS